ncbi:hypothetical protein [Hasllibacter sp. MH4015]|uniref:hypothetical protein n=1 Tax=Hasllibacter sp. MH4015 TaxID=2854029 RepID=UPI001CD4A4CF|nr:hypothetical protein [Hasllibacter sp. MH4015]
MFTKTNSFDDRVNRIQRRRRTRRGGMGFVVHADGVVTAIGRPSSRLRFGFPLKGLLIALTLAVLVKAYLIWFLGVDLYALEVTSLIEGAGYERIAGQIMLPDPISLWMVDRYDAIYAFIQAGMAAGDAG